jgi:hypothetical protein
VPGKSPTQRIDELEARVRDLEAATERDHAVMELRVQTLEAHDAPRQRIEEELRNKVAELAARNAAIEERARHQEKTSDRGFNFAQAAIISVISMIGGALLSLLIQLAIKK